MHDPTAFDDDATAAAPAQWPFASVLVVDDEPGMCNFVQKLLAPHVGQVLVTGSASEAEALLQRHRFELLILDIALPDKSGIALLKDLRAHGGEAEVILITAFAALETAIEALRAGASDFLLKPFRGVQLFNAVKQSLERTRLKRENWVLRRALSQRTPPADGLVGDSLVVKGLQSALRRVATVDSTVLLTGESGTGKELAALALHRLSPSANAPFVPVNCAHISPTLIEYELFGQSPRRAHADAPETTHSADGLFVYAQGGTLFLDEIGELPLAIQATLLRALENRHIRPVGSEHEIPVDVRIIAATNRPLRDDVEAGRFRADLYYRLQVVEIHLPPLRSHKEDIPALVEHFIATLAPRLGVAPIEVTEQEMGYLQQYHWPGNVRELRNLIERSLIVGALNVSALYQSLARAETEPPPRAHQPERRASANLHALEKRHILEVLESVGGSKARAAELLGISRRTLERRCSEWGHP